jgi:mannose-1-phosphate guanylyltransferase
MAPLAPLARTVVVIDVSQTPHLHGHPLSATATIVLQPRDRGTAAGVLLALTPILSSDPDELVVITPSDHGVLDQQAFRRGVLAAATHVVRRGDIVVFGVEPTSARDDYGWITSAPKIGGRVRPVTGFVEKPAADMASELFTAGAVWNTMVTVGRAGTIRDVCFDLLPGLADVFRRAIALPDVDRARFLNDAYADLPRFDFSHDVMSRAPNLSTYIWPRSVGWTDLGTPDRLREWDQQAGRHAARREIHAA